MNLCIYVRGCSAVRICLQDFNVLFREHFLSRSVPKFQNARVTRVLSPRHLETLGRGAAEEMRRRKFGPVRKANEWAKGTSKITSVAINWNLMMTLKNNITFNCDLY